jgi:hypothetical protein
VTVWRLTSKSIVAANIRPQTWARFPNKRALEFKKGG